MVLKFSLCYNPHGTLIQLNGDVMKLCIRNLTKYYGETAAVDKINFDVNDGEFISILGPSGCGKSTFLYMLAGIVEPTSGQILFNDEIVNHIPIEKRNIGLVFQNYSLYPHMTVLENLMFPLLMRNIKKNAASEEAIKIANTLKIDKFLKRKPKELSGGQQQRVAIGRALIKKPGLLLMDEPFSNLDAALRVEMREELKQLQKNFKITTLFVTHDQEEAMSVSDRILLMNKGEVVQYCSGEEMYSSPNSIFSASFIGNPKINIIKNFKGEDTKTAGIRPEDVILLKEWDSEEELFEGNIIDIQKLGKETHFKIDFNGIGLRALMMGNSLFSVGDKVYMKFRKVHYFKE
ncbi:ABC transporter, ATP-binding protein [Clostridiales bacterium oral taxon 876 str. F0540]|nr:ABC transporter, ATP-binding protein [Clostridiales bacterium oral taxon 876 str. F0540]